MYSKKDVRNLNREIGILKIYRELAKDIEVLFDGEGDTLTYEISHPLNLDDFEKVYDDNRLQLRWDLSEANIIDEPEETEDDLAKIVNENVPIYKPEELQPLVKSHRKASTYIKENSIVINNISFLKITPCLKGIFIDILATDFEFQASDGKIEIEVNKSSLSKMFNDSKYIFPSFENVIIAYNPKVPQCLVNTILQTLGKKCSPAIIQDTKVDTMTVFKARNDFSKVLDLIPNFSLRHVL